MYEIVLHHYSQSPVAEKVRVVLGMKGLAWRSVWIPRLPPKPDLVSLTGGYRKTPVMQIGADIYCDSQCIIGELERRHPQPRLRPAAIAGPSWGYSRWTDGPLFTQAVAIVLGAADELSSDFAGDRGRLYFGPDFELERLQASVSDTVVQVRGQLAWIESALVDGPGYLTGDAPGWVDAFVYCIVWFLRGRYSGGPELLANFPAICAWESRVAAVGHGRAHDMDATQALDVARQASTETTAWIDANDPQAPLAGTNVKVESNEPDGTAPIRGTLLCLKLNEIVIIRDDPRVGEVAVHFPRVGYRLLAV